MPDTDHTFSVRMDNDLYERLMEQSEAEDVSAGHLLRQSMWKYLDRIDARAALDQGRDPAVSANAWPHEVMVTLRFTVRADSRFDARHIVDRAMLEATDGLRRGGADDDIEVIGPQILSSSWAWDVDVPPPVTLHFVGDSCPDHVHWRWNDITVDGMPGVFRAPEFKSSPTTLRLRLPGIAEPLPLGLSWRDPHWYVDWDGTHSQVLAAIRPVGQWSEPATEGEITDPLGQLGPVRILPDGPPAEAQAS